MQLGNPLEDRIRASGLGPEKAARAATLIARLNRAMEDQRRLDAAVRASLGRVLRGIVCEEIARTKQESAKKCRS
jgi:hypothetical protein